MKIYTYNLILLKKIVFLLFDFKKKYTFLFFLSLLTGFLELFSIGLIIPMIISLTDSSPHAENNFLINQFINYFGNYTVYMFFSVIILKTITKFYIDLKNNYFANDLRYLWMGKLYNDYLKSNLLFFDRNKVGFYSNNLFSLTEESMRAYKLILNLFFSIIILFVSLIGMFFISFKLSIFVILFILFIYTIVFKKIYQITQALGVKRVKSYSEVNSIPLDFFKNLREVKLLNIIEEAKNSYNLAIMNMTNLRKKINFFQLIPSSTFEPLILFFLLFIFVFSNNFDILKENNSFLPAFIYAFYRFVRSSSDLSKIFVGLKTSLPSLEKLFFELKKEIKSNQNLKTEFSLNNQIIFKNVSFKYPNKEEFVVYELNHTFEASKMNFIFGQTGVGKTTIIDLIIKTLSPSKGRILIGSEDISRIDDKLWTQNICYVSSSSLFINGSLRDNLFYEKINISDKEFFEFAQFCQIPNKLTQNLNINIGENGNYLSSGEKQRVALLRSLIRKPKILILDEATNAIDKSNELKIFKKISEINCTKIVITHNENLLNFSDNTLKI